MVFSSQCIVHSYFRLLKQKIYLVGIDLRIYTALYTVHHQLLLKGIPRKGRCSTVPALLNNITKSLHVGHIPLACRQPRGGQVTPHSRTLSLLSLEGVVGNVLEIKGHLIYEACTAWHKKCHLLNVLMGEKGKRQVVSLPYRYTTSFSFFLTSHSATESADTNSHAQLYMYVYVLHFYITSFHLYQV